MLEGVREYKAGVAAHVIMTGGPTHNKLVEAHAMKVFAVAEGVPAEAIVEEGQAMDTIQNIYFSEKLMEERGWKSAEVVSSPSHLPRTALILQHYSFAWRTHASQWPGELSSVADIATRLRGEAKGCWTLTQYRVSRRRRGCRGVEGLLRRLFRRKRGPCSASRRCVQTKLSC